ncbi:MAG: hypothetical protein EXQ69_00415 [Acidimicrobiia bacterium]|nr:hypothetical protein [Acidimicrobiia bacterium]
MIGLVRVEWRRLTARRLVRVCAIAAIALIFFVVVLTALNSQKIQSDGSFVMRTTSLWLTEAQAETSGNAQDNAVIAVTSLSFLIVAVIGASAIGAEYRAGTVTTVLGWEPRRVRLLAARLIAVALVAASFYLIVHVVFCAAWTIGSVVSGNPDGASGVFWRDLGLVLARGAVLAAVFAVISAAIATLGRNTAAALGVWVGYWILVEGIVLGLKPQWVRWTLFVNIASVLEWNHLMIESPSVTIAVSPGASVVRLTAYVAVFVAVSLAVFHRRDVT